jgi:hypothetical protein
LDAVVTFAARHFACSPPPRFSICSSFCGMFAGFAWEPPRTASGSRRMAAFFATSTWIVDAAGDKGEGSSHGGGNATNAGGGGNGQGDGNANADRGGNGQGGGNANPGGGGNGQGGGNANPGGGGTGQGPEDGGTEEESEQPPQSVEQPSAVPESYTAIPSGPLRVRHRNGFEEEVGAGRYKMHDNRGRLIVNRVVRSSDYVRLRRLIAE